MYSRMVPEINRIAIARMDAAGHRFTRSRQLILATLAEISQPATIPMILQAELRLTQSSLYRNLVILEECGLVTRLTIGNDHALFELSEAVTDHHHHHLVCRHCNTVTDIDLPVQTEKLLDRTLAEATAATGFALEDHRLDLVGICDTCQTASVAS